MNHLYWRILFIPLSRNVQHTIPHLFFVIFLTLSLTLWLLNPYICCPQDTNVALSVDDCQTEVYASSMPDTDSSIVDNGSSQSQSKIQNPLAKGTPKSLPDTTPYIIASVFTNIYPEFRLVKNGLANIKPSSMIVVPLDYPPSL